MSAPQADHYETLGVTPTASLDEIKRRYRELARRYHPDINHAPEAAHQIKVINEAYHVLGDADRRLVYDAERALRQARASSRSEKPPSPDRNTQARQGTRSEPRVRREPGRPGPAGAAATSSASRMRDARQGEVERLLAEAHLAYVNRRFRMAEDFCQQALAINRKSATAFEIIGDIRRAQGQRESAATAYAFAIQLDPTNIGVQIKHDRLMRVPTEGHMGPQMARSTGPSGLQHFILSQRAEAQVGVLNVLATLSFVSLATAVALRNSLPVLFSSAVDAGLVVFILGLCGGLLLAFNGNMRPITEELLSRDEQSDGRRRSGMLGLVLTLLAVVFFYFSVCAFVGFAINRNRLSGSLLRVYMLDFAIALFMAFLAHAYVEAWGSVFMVLFGGNIAFPATLLGWAIGDAVRLRR